MNKYENDFFGWSIEQAHYIKQGQFEKLDIINLQEEIESMGKSEIRALESHLQNALMHMLKQKYQSERNGKSWQSSIKEAKIQANKILKKNPSLKYKLREIFDDAYEIARIAASRETNIDEEIFPINCPWEIEELVN
jgi:hypothetical protein